MTKSNDMWMVNGGSASRTQIYADEKHMLLSTSCCERREKREREQWTKRVINSRDLSNKFVWTMMREIRSEAAGKEIM